MNHCKMTSLLTCLFAVGCGGPTWSDTGVEPNEAPPTMVVSERPRATEANNLINPCGADNPCDPIVTCTARLSGERVCGACPTGFTGDGAELCVFSMDQVSDAISSREQYFATANDEPFPQQTTPSRWRNVWVSIAALDAYRAIDPNDLETQIEPFPVGTMLLHDPVNGPPLGGVMVKREAGYDPELNDWWFGRFSAYNLNFLEPADPRVPGYSGQSCMQCHITEGRPERTDLLWGIPRDALPVDIDQ